MRHPFQRANGRSLDSPRGNRETCADRDPVSRKVGHRARSVRKRRVPRPPFHANTGSLCRLDDMSIDGRDAARSRTSPPARRLLPVDGRGHLTGAHGPGELAASTALGRHREPARGARLVARPRQCRCGRRTDLGTRRRARPVGTTSALRRQSLVPATELVVRATRSLVRASGRLRERQVSRVPRCDAPARRRSRHREGHG
jgi:hypothetical protein